MILKEAGISEINLAKWELDKYNCLNLHVTNPKGDKVHAWLELRNSYCDRGHIQFNIDGIPDIDFADGFPRFFFSFEEADSHVRNFLKWRLWKERVIDYHTLTEPFINTTFKHDKISYDKVREESYV